MAKDPAVLFYTSDFLTGTMTMTNESVGKYVRLLCLQHQRGSLTEKDMLYICGTYEKDIWDKFTKDGGIYYNKRLKDEAHKRQKYSESRRLNRKSPNKIRRKRKLSYVKHMENENENINENINKNNKNKNKNKNKKPTLPQCKEYFLSLRSTLVEADRFFDYYTSNGWKVGKNPMKDWRAAARNWIGRIKTTRGKSGVDVWYDRKKQEESQNEARGVLPSS